MLPTIWPALPLRCGCQTIFCISASASCSTPVPTWWWQRGIKKDFPELHEVKVTLRDFKDLGIFHDLKYYLVHRLSNTIYGSSDTIVTSRMAGSAMTANLGNYTTVSDSATNIGNKIMDSFAAAIGNIVYDKSATANAHDKQVFWGLDLFSYFFGSFVATAYLCLFQPFISLWMGSDRLLPLGFVIVFSLNEYVGWNHRMLGSYRAVLGHFEQDQWFMVASAATNLILSFALFPAFGITGIVAATVVAHCIMGGARHCGLPPVYARQRLALPAGAGGASCHPCGAYGRQLPRVRPAARRYSGAAGAGCCGLHPAQPAEPCVLYLDQRCRLSAHPGWPPLAKNYPSLRGKHNMATIGMLYICTGKYTVFWPEFYETFSRNFLPGCKKNILSLPMHRPSLTRMTRCAPH